MSVLPSKADIRSRDQDVCFGPIADVALCKNASMSRQPSGFQPWILDQLTGA
jgi:hypothetical protein